MLLRRRISRGFTLIEVLLAIALVAVVTASLYVSMFVAFRARKSATEKLDTIRAARLTMDAIGRDLLSALPPTGVLITTFTGTDGTVGASGGGSGGGDSISFSCASRATSSPDPMGDVRRVTLSLMDEADIMLTVPAPAGTTANSAPHSITAMPSFGTPGLSVPGAGANNGPATIRVPLPSARPGHLALVRQVQSNLLSQVQEDPTEEVLCRDVPTFNVRYYNGTIWADSWDSSANNNTLPSAIEVTLEIAPTPPQESSDPDNASALPNASKTPTGNTGQSYRLVRIFVPPCATSATLGTPQ